MLMQNLRGRVGSRLSGNSESGFTLVELLVVMLILGILAAIAIPAFFNQKSKANDAKAKAMAHTVQVAMETCSTDNNGQYTGCNIAKLNEIEPTIPTTAVAGKVSVSLTPAATANAYTIAVTAPGSGSVFSVINNAGAITYPCTVTSTNRGGCPGTGKNPGTWN